MFHSSRTRFSLHKHGYYLFKAPSVPLITLSAGEADSIVQGETKLGTPDAGKKAEVVGAEAAGASKLRSDNQPLCTAHHHSFSILRAYASPALFETSSDDTQRPCWRDDKCDEKVATAQSHGLRYWVWGHWDRLYCGPICPLEDHRGEGANGW